VHGGRSGSRSCKGRGGGRREEWVIEGGELFVCGAKRRHRKGGGGGGGGGGGWVGLREEKRMALSKGNVGDLKMHKQPGRTADWRRERASVRELKKGKRRGTGGKSSLVFKREEATGN